MRREQTASCQFVGAFVDPAYFAPERFGKVDPFSAEFQKRCADARSNKKGG
jgi:sarcosine oxidase, subunit beta